MFVSRRIAAAMALVLAWCLPAHADVEDIPSSCIAMAKALPGAIFVGLTPGARLADIVAPVVTITFVGHSTYLLQTPGGVTIATDYAGWAGPGVVPRVVTMNKAHSSHYTLSPDPAIEHVLPGWNPDGGPARHRLKVGDVYIRNVPTDIRFYGGMEPDGNSIFIFEVAGLCIGHLGHLHHRLEDRHFAAIGRLDIVMVPVDGGLTLSHEGMTEITRRLQSSIVLPMHRRGMEMMDRFISMMGDGFAADFRSERAFTVSLATLPRRPTIVVLSGF
jgi:L-ascorbate metabolism protein UlaG (beta-lactamase superfamily)